ncbi:MAG: hypothetical protein SGJ24_15990, partial [Chloroflexota bacterium]|nr:hypothetical protein [Chloroflexota bacterium]
VGRQRCLPTTLAQGVFTILDIPRASYTVWLKQAQALAMTLPVDLTHVPSAGLDFGTLRMGDVNDSNAIDISDFSLLAASFGKTTGQAGFDARADLDASGAVNINDFSLLASNFGQSGAPDPDGGMLSAAASDFSRRTVDLTIRAVSRLRIGDEMMVTVRARTGLQPIDAATLTVEYDPSRLEAIAVVPGAALNHVLDSTQIPGRINFSAGALETSPQGNISLLTLHFPALTTGETMIAITGGDVRYQGAALMNALESRTITVR